MNGLKVDNDGDAAVNGGMKEVVAVVGGSVGGRGWCSGLDAGLEGLDPSWFVFLALLFLSSPLVRLALAARGCASNSMELRE